VNIISGTRLLLLRIKTGKKKKVRQLFFSNSFRVDKTIQSERMKGKKKTVETNDSIKGADSFTSHGVIFFFWHIAHSRPSAKKKKSKQYPLFTRIESKGEKRRRNT
jgi:hypothetical protein